MADLAKLGLSVDSSDVRTAIKDTGKFEKSAHTLEAAVHDLTKVLERSGVVQKKANTATQKGVAANDNARRSIDRTREANSRYEVSGNKVALTQKKVNKTFSMAAIKSTAMGNAMGLATRAAGGLAVAIGAVLSVRGAFGFQDSLAEVSTLVDTATFDMDRLKRAALEQSAAFGGGAAQQTKAFYDIISAGAETSAQAIDILTASNKLAVGGVTTVAVAADGLTGILNAYGEKAGGAANVSNVLFTGMKAGKTTIAQLASGLGKVAPLAVASGVSLNELVASVAALTKGSITTTESITGVRAILAAVTKPSSEAAKMAKSLGLNFKIAGGEAGGFADFMERVVDKTKGNTKAMAMLFGGVEAIVPALALAGKAGADMSKILDGMKNMSKATQEAFEKMANSPGFQSGRVFSALSAEVLKVTSVIAQALVPAMKFLADNMSTIFKIAGVIGIALAAAFAPAIIAGVWGFATAVSVGAVGAVKLLTLAIAANPLGALVVGITTAIATIWMFRDEIKDAIGGEAFGYLKTFANKTIGLFVGIINAGRKIFAHLPNILNDVFIMAANKVRGGISKIIQFHVEALNWLIRKVNKLPFVNIAEMGSGSFNIAGLANKFAGTAKNVAFAASAEFTKAMNTDFVGGVEDTIAAALKKVKVPKKKTGNGDFTMPDLGKTKKKSNPWADAVKSIKERTAALIFDNSVIGLAKQAQNEYTQATQIGGSSSFVATMQLTKMRIQQELMNQALSAGRKITPELTANISRLAEGYATATVQSKILNAEQERMDKISGSVKSTLTGWWDQAVEGTFKFKDAIVDLGKQIIKSLGNRVITNLVSSLFGGPMGAAGGGGIGSIISSIFGGFRANGGDVMGSKAYVVGERGPEVFMPGQSGTVIPNRMMGANNNMPQQVNVNVSVSGSLTDDNGQLGASIHQTAQQAAGNAVSGYDRGMHNRVQNINRASNVRKLANG